MKKAILKIISKFFRDKDPYEIWLREEFDENRQRLQK